MRLIRLALVALILAVLSLPASAGPIVDVGTIDGGFGTLDLMTGKYTPLSTVPNGDILAGLGFAPNGALLGTGLTGNPAAVYSINPTTGAMSQVGTATPFTSGGSTAGSNGLMFAVDQSNNAQFYSYNPGTNSTHPIGLIGFKSDGLAAFGPSGAFFTDQQDQSPLGNDVLAMVNPNTGAATMIGNGLGFPIWAGVFVNGTLYGFGPNGGNPAIFTIDTATGKASANPVALITGLTPQEKIDGGITAAALPLAPAATIPEPSTLACTLLGVLFAGVARLRRRARIAAGARGQV